MYSEEQISSASDLLDQLKGASYFLKVRFKVWLPPDTNETRRYSQNYF
jgi:hypothetical protein